MKRLLFILPIFLFAWCNITYNDYCQPLAMKECVGYDYYKLKTYSNTAGSNNICEIRCLNVITKKKIDLDVELNKNNF